MKIIWLIVAQETLELIYNFYLEKNPRVAVQIYNSILQEVKVLQHFPNLAPIEEYLEEYPETFRTLVIMKGQFKVTYFIKEENIYILAVMDCRQNLSLLKKILSRH